MPTNNNNINSRSASQSTKASLVNSVVGNHYRIEKKIGQGSFGVIYLGINLINNLKVAIKFEPKKADVPQLKDEYRAYKILSGLEGIPKAHYFGSEHNYYILCLDLLGNSLEEKFDKSKRKFTVKTVAMLAKQMVLRIQSVHAKSLIYRDIKPDNFLMGLTLNDKQSQLVYLVDFGMAKYYRDPKTKAHIPYREKKSLSGTARYMSINTHLGVEQSRRDDLESLGHVFMYFLRGSLPWQGLKANTNKQKYERISEKKQSTKIEDLCEGYPSEFAKYLKYARNLKFEEEPDYNYLIGLFDTVLKNTGEQDDGIFDWINTDEKSIAAYSYKNKNIAELRANNENRLNTNTSNLQSNLAYFSVSESNNNFDNTHLAVLNASGLNNENSEAPMQNNNQTKDMSRQNLNTAQAKPIKRSAKQKFVDFITCKTCL